MAFTFLCELSLMSVGLTVAVLCLAAYAYLDWVYGYWRRRNVPCVPPTSFLFGNIGQMFLGKSNIGTIYTDLYRKFPNSPYVGYYEFQKPALLLRDPRLIQKALVEDFNSFHDNRPEIKQSNDSIFGRNPFFIKGKERWKKERSNITSGLTATKLRHLPESVFRVYQDMKAFLVKTKAEDIEAGELCRRFTCDTAASWAWGIEGGGFSEEDPLVKKIAVNIADEFEVSNFKMMLVAFNPWFVKDLDLIKISIFKSTQKNFIMDVTRQSVQRLLDTKNSTSPCLLNTLIQAKLKAGQSAESLGSEASLEAFSSSLLSFYIDSFETTALTMAKTLYALAVDPEVQTKLRKEVMTLSEEQMKSDDVLKLSYLDMVLSEVLRVYSALTSMSKVCTQKTILGEIVVDRGTSIIIPVRGLHTDPKYFSDPEKFKPERFSNENRAFMEGAYLPFGIGPRQCPGNRFASNQVKLLISRLVRDFELLPAEDHEMYPVEPKADTSLFIPKHPLFIRIQPLNSR